MCGLQKALLVGHGPQGRRLAQSIAAVRELSLTAVVDRDPQALVGIPESVTTYSSVEAALSASSFDLACIATNGPTHAPIANLVMEADCRFLYVEKPMACSLGECQQMQKTARQFGVQLAIGHCFRYSPCFRLIRDALADGKWGQLRAIHMQRPGIGLGCQATHSFDLIRFLSGMEVRTVISWVDGAKGPNPRGDQFVDPGGTVVLELANDTRAIVEQIEDGAGPRSIDIYTTTQRIRIDDKMGVFEVISMERDATQHAPRFVAELDPEGIDAQTDIVRETANLLRDLCCTGSGFPTGEDGFRSTEVLIASYLSSEQGHLPISLPLQEEHFSKWLPVT